MRDGERLHYVAVAPPPAPSVAGVEKAQPPTPVPKPVVPLPKPIVKEPTPAVKPVAPPAVAAIAPSATPQLAMAGAGTGDSGTSGGQGAGPGSGGGVGSGAGTGRGSGTGPGTGGGTGDIYPATPDFLVMPALPVPSKVRGKTIRLVFELDASGKITSLKFDSTGDSGYDKELRERLMDYRFRPAHKADGTPVPSVYVTELTL
jgi:protein TonB